MTGNESNTRELLAELQRIKKDTRTRTIDLTLKMDKNPRGDQIVTPLGVGKLVSTTAELGAPLEEMAEKTVTYSVTVRVKISNAIFELKKKLAAA